MAADRFGSFDHVPSRQRPTPRVSHAARASAITGFREHVTARRPQTIADRPGYRAWPPSRRWQAPGRLTLTRPRPRAGRTGSAPMRPWKTAVRVRRGGRSRARLPALRAAGPFRRSYRWDCCDDSSAISRPVAVRAAGGWAPDPRFISLCGQTPTHRGCLSGVYELKLAVPRAPLRG